MVRRTKLDAEKTRQNLMDAAETLFLEQGVTRTSLDQVARRAGVTRGAVYWHFKNKVDLLHGLIQRVDLKLDAMFADLLAQYQDTRVNDSVPVLDAMMSVLRHFYTHLDTDERHQRVMSILVNRLELVGEMAEVRTLYEDKAAKTVEALEGLFTLSQSRGEIAASCEPARAAALVHTLLVGLIMETTCTPCSRSLKDAPSLFAMIFDGLRRAV